MNQLCLRTILGSFHPASCWLELNRRATSNCKGVWVTCSTKFQRFYDSNNIGYWDRKLAISTLDQEKSITLIIQKSDFPQRRCFSKYFFLSSKAQLNLSCFILTTKIWVSPFKLNLGESLGRFQVCLTLLYSWCYLFHTSLELNINLYVVRVCQFRLFVSQIILSFFSLHSPCIDQKAQSRK